MLPQMFVLPKSEIGRYIDGTLRNMERPQVAQGAGPSPPELRANNLTQLDAGNDCQSSSGHLRKGGFGLNALRSARVLLSHKFQNSKEEKCQLKPPQQSSHRLSLGSTTKDVQTADLVAGRLEFQPHCRHRHSLV